MSQSASELEQEAEAKTRLRLWLKLLKVSRKVEAELRENLRTNFGTTLPRFDVMSALNRYPKGLRMSELSGVLKVSNGNVTGIVDRLVKGGLIIRSEVPGDRRALKARLTKRGQEDFLLQAKEHEAWIDNILSDISLEEVDQIMGCLENVIPVALEEENNT
ncbi:MAG: MarR family transcriptional regulator [Rhizobiaceae bacterium]